MGKGRPSESQEELLQRKKDEIRALQGIITALKKRVDTSTTFQTTLQSPAFKGPDYLAERMKIVTLSNVGVMEGILASGFTFFVLRRVPSMIGRRIERRVVRSGYRLDPSASRNPFEQSQHQQAEKPSLLRRGFRIFSGTVLLGIDIVVSLLVGARTSMYFTDGKECMSIASNLPLIEGRSVLCDEFCTTVQQEVAKNQQINPQFWKDVITRQDNLYLEGAYRFSTNCQKRQAYERKLRLEQGLAPSDPVSIPKGGVPSDIELEDEGNITLASDSGESEFDELSFNDGDSLFGDTPTADWADSLVTDRDNSRK
ncbi:hypothetical protein MHU86_6632 [Fragilaria crotonensis]|nr:hypothetical protein MHU86_6632 [Fragilaria crotonensis]